VNVHGRPPEKEDTSAFLFTTYPIDVVDLEDQR